MTPYDRLNLMVPVDRLAKRVTDQSGATDRVAQTALETRVQHKDLHRRRMTARRKGQEEPAVMRGDKVRERITSEASGLSRLKVGDPFLVLHLNGELAYADRVCKCNPAVFRGEKNKRRAFQRSTGFEARKEYYARVHWPDEEIAQ